MTSDRCLEARALWFTGPHDAVLRCEPLPSISGPGFCTIRSLYSAVSSGTEHIVLAGRVPPELHQSMRVPYMGGDFSFPVKYGYSLVATVENGPPHLAGKIVHVLHPHQDLCLVEAADAFPIPENIPPHRAVLASNLETAVTALWDGRPAIGERVLVVGFGCIGALIAHLLRGITGIRLVVVEADDHRRQLAASLGYQAEPPGGAADFDLAFHASGSGSGLQEAIDRVMQEGRVIDVSWYGSGEVTLRLGATFHIMRKSLVSSQVSNIPGYQAPRWDRPRRKRLVFELLRAPLLDRLIGDPLPFAELPEFFNRPRSAGGPLVTLVKYR